MDDRGFLLDDDATAQDVYSTLHGEEFRTLLLGPSSNKETPISCEMQVVASPRRTQFEALSYVWGDAAVQKARSIISCNGFDFPVTESLHSALVHLRYPNAWRRLWVDQLSINQVEQAEVMEQIANMGTLFSSASRVIVWLGRYDQKMAMAFELLQEEAALSSSLVRSDFLHSPSQPHPHPHRRQAQLPPPKSASPPRRTLRRQSSSSSSLSKYSSRASNSSTSLVGTTSRSPARVQKPNRNSSSPAALKHALAIFQNVYFDRKWTFQEIVLAKAAIICCGDLEMAWSDLSQWYFHYASKLRSSSLLYDSRGSFENIINVRNGLGKGTLRLSNLLMLTRPRMSMKPEDAVYALMGLVPDLAKSLEPVSDGWERHRSQDERLFRLYLKAFEFCLERDNDLSILSAAGRYKGNVEAANWPGWLPDWRQQLPLRPLVLADPAGVSPEAAFDDEEEEGVEEPVQIGPTPMIQERRPIYQLKLNALPPSRQFPSRHTLMVYGVRLGCIVTRPQTWPSSFLVADPVAQSFLDSRGASDAGAAAGGGEGQFMQSLVTLAPSIMGIDSPPRRKQQQGSYAARLIQSSLHNAGADAARCRPVRISAMVESGDWVCAFQGGRVLYAIRPIEKVDRDRRDHRAQQRIFSPSSSSSSAFKGNTSPRHHLFLGECAVQGLKPSEILQTTSDMMAFELV